LKKCGQSKGNADYNIPLEDPNQQHNLLMTSNSQIRECTRDSKHKFQTTIYLKVRNKTLKFPFLVTNKSRIHHKLNASLEIALLKIWVTIDQAEMARTTHAKRDVSQDFKKH